MRLIDGLFIYPPTRVSDPWRWDAIRWAASDVALPSGVISRTVNKLYALLHGQLPPLRKKHTPVIARLWSAWQAVFYAHVSTLSLEPIFPRTCSLLVLWQRLSAWNFNATYEKRWINRTFWKTTCRLFTGRGHYFWYSLWRYRGRCNRSSFWVSIFVLLAFVRSVGAL